ncbi:hypothetical protein PAHAL_1G408800 [Panicum hallii]|uniref:Uncharacterized protein n=1 Tax=Panicum hallii TaxID=206008 RepID=A0A2S3GTD3_9POAL|nr:hypothetical protein PAHAL_1G408800 [Panicum hallii]
MFLLISSICVYIFANCFTTNEFEYGAEKTISATSACTGRYRKRMEYSECSKRPA